MGKNRLLSALFGEETRPFQKTSFTLAELQTLARVIDLVNADGATWKIRDGQGTDVIDMIGITSAKSTLSINLYKMCEHQDLYVMDAMGVQSYSRDFAMLILNLGGKLEDFTLIEQLIATEPDPPASPPPELARK